MNEKGNEKVRRSVRLFYFKEKSVLIRGRL